MDANTYPTRLILSQERRYLIPTFQRDYEWTRDGQWELLFDDLEAVAGRLERARASVGETGGQVTTVDKDVAPHFLGAIVLDQLPSSAGGIDLRAVIDGQQRLTTLQLLLRGMLDVLVEVGSPRASQVRRLLLNPDDVVQSVEERPKLWPRRHDRDVWLQVMADDAPEAPKGHPYVQAREYFADRTRASMDDEGERRVETLVDGALDLFKIVVIDLEGNDDAQVIFEVLNGRQTPLTAADLVKNLLFLRAELADESELEALYDEYWAPFDSEWWKTTVGRGHAARGRRDLLLSSWLSAVSGSEVNVGHLYQETREYIAESKRLTPDLLAELDTYGRAYERVSIPDVSDRPRLASAYRRLDRLGVTTALPLLLWLETRPAESLSHEQHEQAVLAVESWVVRRMITGANTRGYAKAFIDVLVSARAAAPGEIHAAVSSALADFAGSLAWPDDAAVESAFVGRRMYADLTQERVRLLLAAIDAQLQGERKKGEQATFDYDKLQIEHVMPQAWTKHWPVSAADEASRALAEQRRQITVDRIGNLTLVTAPLNGSVSNGPWPAKKEALQEHAQLVLSAMVAGADQWDEDAIDVRAQALAAAACRVWESPPAP